MFRGYLKKIVRTAADMLGYQIQRSDALGMSLGRDIVSLIGKSDGGLTIIDVGANSGQTAEFMLQSFPDAVIHSFEPTPSLLPALHALAGESGGRLHVHGFALSDQSGLAKFHLNDSSATNSLSSFHDAITDVALHLNVSSSQTVDVNLETLDGFAAGNGISRVDLLKSDTQGHDLQVLLGAANLLSQKRVRMILCEVNFVPVYEQQSYFHEIYSYLSGHGFRLVGLYDTYRNTDGSIAWADALFMLNQSAPTNLL